MINEPIVLNEDNFQQAWLEVVRILMRHKWEVRNLVVQIKSPEILDNGIHERVKEFAQHEGLLTPRQVAYTIFPHSLYKHQANSSRLFDAYNRPNGIFERLQRRKRSWGTYFRRMTRYQTEKGPVNQLENIIYAIRKRQNISKAAYTIVIQNPGGETIKPLGGPCLNYIAVQIEPGQPNSLGLLAVYRNHDFLERAYGNYWGLCKLLCFIAKETGADLGPLTCLSSHAYVLNKKIVLKILAEGL